MHSSCNWKCILLFCLIIVRLLWIWPGAALVHGGWPTVFFPSKTLDRNNKYPVPKPVSQRLPHVRHNADNRYWGQTGYIYMIQSLIYRSSMKVSALIDNMLNGYGKYQECNKIHLINRLHLHSTSHVGKSWLSIHHSVSYSQTFTNIFLELLLCLKPYQQDY
jgi:hypothetical protein